MITLKPDDIMREGDLILIDDKYNDYVYLWDGNQKLIADKCSKGSVSTVLSPENGQDFFELIEQYPQYLKNIISSKKIFQNLISRLKFTENENFILKLIVKRAEDDEDDEDIPF